MIYLLLLNILVGCVLHTEQWANLSFYLLGAPDNPKALNHFITPKGNHTLDASRGRNFLYLLTSTSS